MRTSLVALCLAGLIAIAVATSGPTASSAGAAPRVFTTTQVVKGLLHHPRRWEGKIVLVRGRFVPYPGPQCSPHRPCPFRGGLSDTGLYVNLLTLHVTPATRKLLTVKPATYRVRLHLAHYGTTRQPEGYLLARVS